MTFQMISITKSLDTLLRLGTFTLPCIATSRHTWGTLEKKTHGNWCILLGWCDGPSISGKISMKNLDFSEKKQDETQRCCVQNSRKRGSSTCHSFFESTLGDWKLRKYRLWPGEALHGSNMVEFWVSDFISLSKWEIPPWNYYFQWGCKRSM